MYIIIADKNITFTFEYAPQRSRSTTLSLVTPEGTETGRDRRVTTDRKATVTFSLRTETLERNIVLIDELTEVLCH